MNDKQLENCRKFIEKAKIVHKNENIDYTNIEYVDNRTNVCLVDHDLKEDGTEYGEFWQTPSNHLKGQSHPLKRKFKYRNSRGSKQDDVIERFKKVHEGENLDYSEVEYVNMHTKVKIIDHDLREDGTEYGEFWQEPVVHLKGCGHPKKGILKQSKTITSNTDELIKKTKIKHKLKKYDYSLVNYVNNRTKIKIICNETSQKGKYIHGEFLISPDNLLSGKGCPKCGNHLSYGEDEIVNILSHHLKVEKNNRTVLNGFELDIYIPSHNIAIEYNGLRWHSEEFGKDKYYHLNKTLQCKEKGIKLIHVFEDEYINSKKIVLNKIKHILGISEELPKIMGRKCVIEEINNDTAKSFLNTYHIQGYSRSTVHLGAVCGDELIAVMSFKKETKECLKWELTRFASHNNYICQGVGGKLFKYFIKNYKAQEVKSFADRRWTLNEEDNLYTKLGFELTQILPPDYRYIEHNKRMHKFGFRKQILNKKYGLPLTMTEKEMVDSLGIKKIWDCGLLKYVWKQHD